MILPFPFLFFLGSLESLEELYLNDNQFLQHIPFELALCRKLGLMSVEGCPLSSVPVEYAEAGPSGVMRFLRTQGPYRRWNQVIGPAVYSQLCVHQLHILCLAFALNFSIPSLNLLQLCWTSFHLFVLHYAWFFFFFFQHSEVFYSFTSVRAQIDAYQALQSWLTTQSSHDGAMSSIKPWS